MADSDWCGKSRPPPGFDPRPSSPQRLHDPRCTKGNAVRVHAVKVLDRGKWPGFFLRLLYPLQKKSFEWETCWAPDPVSTFRINILPLPGSEARFLDYPTLAVTLLAPTFTRSSYGHKLQRSCSTTSYGP